MLCAAATIPDGCAWCGVRRLHTVTISVLGCSALDTLSLSRWREEEEEVHDSSVLKVWRWPSKSTLSPPEGHNQWRPLLREHSLGSRAGFTGCRVPSAERTKC